MGFCRNCGNEIPEGTKFCPNCGTAVDVEVAVNLENAKNKEEAIRVESSRHSDDEKNTEEVRGSENSGYNDDTRYSEEIERLKMELAQIKKKKPLGKFIKFVIAFIVVLGIIAVLATVLKNKSHKSNSSIDDEYLMDYADDYSSDNTGNSPSGNSEDNLEVGMTSASDSTYATNVTSASNTDTSNSEEENLTEEEIAERVLEGIGLMYTDRYKALDIFEKMAKLGNDDAKFLAGYMFDWEGDNFSMTDYNKAKEYYEMVEDTNPYAMYCLGCLYHNGECGDRDDKKANKYYKKAMDLIDESTIDSVEYVSVVYGIMGNAYHGGFGKKRDFKKALEYFEKAHEAGNPWGAYYVAQIYGNGDGVKQDTTEAMEWLKKSAALGNASAIRTLENINTKSSSTTSDTNSDGNKETNGVDPKLKAFLDSYEAFVDEYVAFMKNYLSDSGNVISMLSDYTKIMTKYEKFAAEVEKYNSKEMSNADAKYYLDVVNRCNKKMLDVY